MPTPAIRPSALLKGLARFALAATLVALASSDASAQVQLFGGRLEAHNRAFYGPDYFPTSYADSLGLGLPRRCENGGYYGPPQIYSRQYGSAYGFRTARPFTRPRNFGGTGYGGASPSTY
jgi:hypothetical protein